jgi:hypothetical protein
MAPQVTSNNPEMSAGGNVSKNSAFCSGNKISMLAAIKKEQTGEMSHLINHRTNGRAKTCVFLQR